MTPKTLHKKLSERLHEHDIMEILFYAQENKTVSKALLGAIYDNDVKVARNALWVLTWEQIDKFISERNKFVEIALRAHPTINVNAGVADVPQIWSCRRRSVASYVTEPKGQR